MHSNQPAPVFICLPCSMFYCTCRDWVFVQVGGIKSFINSRHIDGKNFNPYVLCSGEKRNCFFFFLFFIDIIFLHSRLQTATTSLFPQVRPAAVLAAPLPLLPSSALCLWAGDSWGSSPAWGSLSSYKCERCDCLLIQPVTFCHRSGSEISFEWS